MAQRFRDDGPEHHRLKGRVPTGAGIVLAGLLLIAGCIAAPFAEEGAPSLRLGVWVCWAAGLMGLLGWIDDRRKVVRGTAGLRARFKFPVMIAVGLGLLYFLSAYFQDWAAASALTAHSLPWPVFASPWVYYPVGLFVWLGALNGANFTDGLDGLLSLTTLVIIAGAFFALLDHEDPLALPAAVGFGVLAAFLVFNWPPALLYLGDSGALAAGGLVAGLFLGRGWWLFLGLAACVWVAEVVSVMAQVVSFRLTGRRVLLMSPLHHHFELAGWSEKTVVLTFAGLQLLGCVAALAWLRIGVEAGIAAGAVPILLLAVLTALYRRRVR